MLFIVLSDEQGEQWDPVAISEFSARPGRLGAISLD